MRNLLFFWLLACSFPLASPAQNVLRVFFTNKQTEPELKMIQKNLLNIHNIQVEYQHLKFDGKGHLVEISFSVDFREGMKCSSGPFLVSGKKRYGFERNYKRSAKKPFECGEIKRRK